MRGHDPRAGTLDVAHPAHAGAQHERLLQHALELGAGRLTHEAGERDGEGERGEQEPLDARSAHDGEPPQLQSEHE